MSQPLPLVQGQLEALSWPECLAAEDRQPDCRTFGYRRVNPAPCYTPGWAVRAGQLKPGRPLHRPPLSERELDRLVVERWQHGDKFAFNLLVSKYQRKLLRVVSRLIHNATDAEDIVQDTFVRAYRALPAFRHESAFYTWLFQIAINASKNFLRKQKLKANVSVQLNPGADDQSFEDPASIDDRTPLSELENKQTLAVLNTVLDALPDKLAGALLLRELEGMTYEEIAQVQGCPIGTVRSRIFRARELIATRLAVMIEPSPATRSETRS